MNANAGNYYITWALARMLQLGPGNLVDDTVWSPLPEHTTFSERAWGAGAIVLPLQDQLRTSFPDEDYVYALSLLKTLEKDGAPMVVVSLGANSFDGQDPELAAKLSPARVRFFHYLSERCVSMGVRGPFSAEVLNKLGIKNVEIVGCPTYFETGRGRIVKPAESVGTSLSVAATGTFRTEVPRARTVLQGDFEWPLIELLHQLDGPLSNKSIEAVAGGRHHLFMLSEASNGNVFFANDPSIWKQRLREECVVAIGTRLHGAIAALNAGVPSVVLNPDARAQETCELFGIPWLPSQSDWGAPIERICEMAEVNTLNDRYPALYERFAEWMAHNGLPISDGLPTLLPPSNLPRATQEVIVSRITSVRERALEIEYERALAAEGRVQAATDQNHLDRAFASSAATQERAALEKLMFDLALTKESNDRLILELGCLLENVKCFKHVMAENVELGSELRQAELRLLEQENVCRIAEIDNARVRNDLSNLANGSAIELRAVQRRYELAIIELNRIKAHWIVRLAGIKSSTLPLHS